QLLNDVAGLDRPEHAQPALDADLSGPGPALLAEAVPVVDPLGEVLVGVGEALAPAQLGVRDLVEVADQAGLVDLAVLVGALAQPREVGVVGVDRHEPDQAAPLQLEVVVGTQALGDAPDRAATRAAEADE